MNFELNYDWEKLTSKIKETLSKLETKEKASWGLFLHIVNLENALIRIENGERNLKFFRQTEVVIGECYDHYVKG